VNALGALHATGLGFGLGVVTGMPIGVINVAIADAAVLGRRRFARGLGIGGGGADAVHAMLAFAGFGTVVTAAPGAVRGLAIVATIVIIGYAVVAWRSRRRGGPVTAVTDDNGATSTGTTGDGAAARDASSVDDRPVGRGVVTGVLITLPNPAALAAWVAVAAALWPDAELIEAALLAVSVGLGSALWFTLLARWIGRRRDHRLLAVIPRIALGMLIAIAVVGVIRAL
jgi:threonine/homoserine/homoserine lactone efflux protein